MICPIDNSKPKITSMLTSERQDLRQTDQITHRKDFIVAPRTGGVLHTFKHNGFNTFEQQYRIQPQEGWFSVNVNPNRPIQFELGSYTVPQNQTLWLLDYEFSIYRPSGIDSGDFILAEEGRFSNQIGFDLTVSGERIADIMMELDPHAPISGGMAFSNATGIATPQRFRQSQARSFTTVAGQGTAVIPPRRQPVGAENAPFTVVVTEGRVLSCRCVIFHRIRSPLSCIQANVRGYTLSRTLSDRLMKELKP